MHVGFGNLYIVAWIVFRASFLIATKVMRPTLVTRFCKACLLVRSVTESEVNERAKGGKPKEGDAELALAIQAVRATAAPTLRERFQRWSLVQMIDGSAVGKDEFDAQITAFGGKKSHGGQVLRPRLHAPRGGLRRCHRVQRRGVRLVPAIC